ncbi:MAG: hypothetical protein ABI461_21735, partial [Polyangiaceae bacterium]
GDNGALGFEIQDRDGERVILATGFQAEIGITRTDAQWQNCIISKNVPAPVSATPPTPGAGTLAPKDSCSDLNTEPIQLINASCDNDACAVTEETVAGGIVALLITGKRDGDTTLRVNVKSTSGSSTWGDSFPLTFATPVSVGVHRQDTETNQPGYAFMPGASFRWCPSLNDANGNVLTEIPSSITNALSGAAVSTPPPDQYAALTNCVSFSASAPGTSAVTFDAQSLTTTDSILVANPSDIVGAELRAFTNASESVDGGTENDGGADGGAASGTIEPTATTLIELTTDDFYGHGYASLLTLKDGTHALGGAGFYQSTFVNAVSVLTNDTDPQMARTTLSVAPDGSVIGDGQVVANINGIAISVPFHISAAPSETDAGTR